MSERPLDSQIRMTETNPQDVDPVAERAWVDEIHAEMLTHVEDGSFHSEVDRQIAKAFADSIHGAFVDGVTTFQTYDTAMGSLGALVPVTGVDGRRRIAGKPLSRMTEKWITSRLESREVDMLGSEGAWGKLPQAVRETVLTTNPQLQIEITANCTAACTFCCFADKGEITSKASFASVEAIIQEFTAHQPPDTIPADHLYYGTDPFDAKWKLPDGNELDYLSIARSYANITGRGRVLGTSTAVPIGEEFRVMFFINQLLTTPDFEHGGSIRLSRSTKNADRIDHIVNALNGVGPITSSERFIISDLTGVGNIALRGSAWNRTPDRKISHWDIMGPNGFDGVVLSPGGAKVVVMQGASPEQPNGEIRFPLDDDLGDGKHLYVVPVRYDRPDYEHGTYKSNEIYPDTGVWVYKFENGIENESPKYGTVERYPHRALLRLMAAATLYDYGSRNNGYSQEAAQADFKRNFAQDLEIVRTYLSSHENQSMDRALEILTEHGYIS